MSRCNSAKVSMHGSYAILKRRRPLHLLIARRPIIQRLGRVGCLPNWSPLITADMTLLARPTAVAAAFVLPSLSRRSAYLVHKSCLAFDRHQGALG